jgi:hypothetical protein
VKKTLFLLLSILGLLLSAPGAAVAANPHEVPNDPIVCVENADLTVSCSGSVAGLGNQAVIVQVDVDFACATRGNANQPGGHLQAQTGPIQPRNGRITFTGITTGPADCPPGLNPVVGDTATLSIFDLNDNLLFQATVAIEPAPTP